MRPTGRNAGVSSKNGISSEAHICLKALALPREMMIGDANVGNGIGGRLSSATPVELDHQREDSPGKIGMRGMRRKG